MASLKKLFENIHEKTLFLIPVLLGLLAAIPTLIPKSVNMIPNHGRFSYTIFTDTVDGGNSEVLSSQVDENQLALNFIIRDNSEGYPYVGFHTDLDSTSRFMDFSDYDRAVISIETPEEINVQLHLRAYQKGVTDTTDTEKHLTYRFLRKTLKCLNEKNTFEISMDDFITPKWWFSKNNVTSKKVGKPDLKRVSELVIQNDGDIRRNREHSFKITALRFERNMGKRFAMILVYIALYFGAYYGLYYLIVMRKDAADEAHGNIFVPYEKVEMTSELESDLGKITGYITKNYTNPDLSLVQVAAVVNINKKRVSALLKERYELSFKQYINGLRLTEAKRLLTETDRRISEIATSVGYTNVTHFNRVFKQAEEVSPKTYRTNKTKK